MNEVEHLLGSNIKSLMSSRGYKSGDLARAMNISEAAANAWMTGRNVPRLQKIPALCEWLGCDANALFTQRGGGSSGISCCLSDEEYAVIARYRGTDDVRREVVKDVLKI